MQQGHRRRYSRRRQRRIRQLQLLVAVCILATGVVLACTARHRSKQEAKEAAEASAAQAVTQELALDELPAQNPEPEEEPEPEQDWDEEARYMAQACFGEGWICQSKTEWAAIYWNILNRVDSDDPYYPDNIIGVITQSAQYHGYDPTNPVLPVLKELALDVIDRWQRENRARQMWAVCCRRNISSSAATENTTHSEPSGTAANTGTGAGRLHTKVREERP